MDVPAPQQDLARRHANHGVIREDRLHTPQRAGFEIQDVEALRRHYALTLRHWVQRLEANRDAALREVDEPTYRVWRLYMAACALEFEAGGTGIYQILASRRGVETSLPLTRQDLYAPAQAPVGATLPPRIGA